MLPTERLNPKKGELMLFYKEQYSRGKYKKGTLSICATNNANVDLDTWQVQHLYIISDEEIKEDNWVKHGLLNIIYQVDNNNLEATLHNKCKKIIASTNKLLKLSIIPQSFIKEYIDSYNKGNIITEVELEIVKSFHGYFNEGGEDWRYKIETNSNNEVIISVFNNKIYTYSEMIKILTDYDKYICDITPRDGYYNGIDFVEEFMRDYKNTK